MSRCLVTGGAGFIGSHLVDTLLNLGHSVTVFDNFSTGRIENIKQHLSHITLCPGDLINEKQIQAAAVGCDVIYHLAASSSVAESLRNPILAHDNNVTGTINLLDAARLAGTQKIVFASSAAIYGTNPVMPKQETFAGEPVNPYGLSKFLCEQYLQMYSSIFGLEVACMRFFNVYGPRQNPNSDYSGVISKFMNAYITGQTPKVFGNGMQSRDFVYVADIVQALILAMEPLEEKFNIFNVCTGESHTLLDVLDALSGIFEKQLPPEFLAARPNDIFRSVGSNAKITETLGFAPTYTFNEGLLRLVASILNDQLGVEEAALQPVITSFVAA